MPDPRCPLSGHASCLLAECEIRCKFDQEQPDPRNHYAAYRQVHPWGEWWLVATEDEWLDDTYTAKCHTQADAERIAAALNREAPDA